MIRIIILVSAALLLPSIQHFILDEPMDNCLLADLCNHTWVPECGVFNRSQLNLEPDFRVFIDECDMFEYNCDDNKNYTVTNFTECFPPVCLHLPQQRYRRAGNYKVMENRRLIYEPTTKVYPMHMMHGKRRYTPQPGRKLKKTSLVTQKQEKTLKTTKARRKTYPKKVTRLTPKTNQLQETTKKRFILKRVTVKKNGKIFVKVVKGVKSRAETQSTPRTSLQTQHDSEFLE